MKVLFLCGGAGRRMFPLTEDKFLMRFLGRTLLEHQIGLALKAGISEFVVVGNPGNIGRIEEILHRMRPTADATDGTSASAIALTAIQKEPLGIANAIENAHRHLRGEFIIVNPNDIFDISAYSLLLEARRRTEGDALILAKDVQEYFPGGYLVLENGEIVRNIVEKPEPGKEPSRTVNLLVHLHTDADRLVKYIHEQPAGGDDVYERAVSALACQTGNVRAVRYGGPWTAIKYPWHVLDATRHFLDGVRRRISPRASVSASATIDGRVVIESGARVLENAVIRGPAYIGRSTVVGNSALVRDHNHIGDNCVIGFGTEIKGSYLGDGCQTHMNYIGDSVVAEGCSFGAGTITANWRFDERNIRVNIEGKPIDTGRTKLGAVIGRNCRTGVNVSIMPGVKIAADTRIAPGTVVSRDIGGGG